MANLRLFVLSQSRLLRRTGPPFLCSFQGCYIMLLLCWSFFFFFSYFVGFCDRFLVISTFDSVETPATLVTCLHVCCFYQG